MESANRYLNKVKAQTNLKEKTISYVEENLPDIKKIHKSPMRKFAFAACAVFAAGVLSAGGYAYYQTPVNYISVDINPSVELGINAFGRVVRAEGFNEDGEKIVKNLKVKNKSVEDAVSELVGAAVDQDYIAEDGSSVISVTSQSDDENEAEELEELGTSGANKALIDESAYAAVLGDSADFNLREEALALGVSPGKYKLILMLKVLDPTINVEDYKDMKAGEIMKKAKELISLLDNYAGNNGEIGKILGTIASYSTLTEEAQEGAKNKNPSNENISTEQNEDTNTNTETNQYTQTNGTTKHGNSNGNNNGTKNTNNGNAKGRSNNIKKHSQDTQNFSEPPAIASNGTSSSSGTSTGSGT